MISPISQGSRASQDLTRVLPVHIFAIVPHPQKTTTYAPRHGSFERSWFSSYRYIHHHSVFLIRSLLTLGAHREVKKAVEAYWAGKLTANELTKAAADVKKESWTSVRAKGVDLIPR
jgi:hypothetical protein